MFTVHPVRYLRRLMLSKATPDKNGVRVLTRAQRKMLQRASTAWSRQSIEAAIAEELRQE
jgi:hypothetical protein